jgi:hypothetical protein
MRCALWLALLTVLELSGCETVKWWDPLGLCQAYEKRTDPDILGHSLTTLSGDGELYADTAPGTVARSWVENLKRLGLPTSLDEAHCVHSATPDGHHFAINVVVTMEIADDSVSHTRAYLLWQERDYSTRGWQVLTDLERAQPITTVKK